MKKKMCVVFAVACLSIIPLSGANFLAGFLDPNNGALARGMGAINRGIQTGAGLAAVSGAMAGNLAGQSMGAVMQGQQAISNAKNQALLAAQAATAAAVAAPGQFPQPGGPQFAVQPGGPQYQIPSGFYASGSPSQGAGIGTSSGSNTTDSSADQPIQSMPIDKAEAQRLADIEQANNQIATGASASIASAVEAEQQSGASDAQAALGDDLPPADDGSDA